MPVIELVDLGHRQVCLEVSVWGSEPRVAMLPSAHRGFGDYERLASDLMSAGHASVGINVRGVGRSTGTLDGLDLRDVAGDVAEVLSALSLPPVHLVGHALGQVFARATASYRPEVVRSVTLLACGGHDRAWRPPPVELLEHFNRCSDLDLPDDVRLESLQALFFAPGNDPAVWLDGWWPHADAGAVFGQIEQSEWATAGDVPVLILQPMRDPLCVPAVGHELLDALGARGALVEVPDCSHAMLPEQPERISEAIISFFGSLPDSA